MRKLAKETKTFRNRLATINRERVRAFSQQPVLAQAVFTDDHKTILADGINLGNITVNHSMTLAAMMNRAEMKPEGISEADYPFDTDLTETVQALLVHFRTNVLGVRSAAAFLEALGLYQAAHTHMIEIVRLYGDDLVDIDVPAKVRHLVALRPIYAMQRASSYVIRCSLKADGGTTKRRDTLRVSTEDACDDDDHYWFAALTV